MLGLIQINKGLGEPAKEYLSELGFKNISIKESFAIFDADIEMLCRLSYINQIGSKILLVLGKTNALGESFYEKALSEIPEIISYKTFKIYAGEKLIGPAASAAKKSGKNVDLSNPDMAFEIIEDPENMEYYFCIDFSGESSKRDYKIFHTPASLKGTTAFGLLKMAGYARKKGGGKKTVLMDPYCNDGTIIVEAALYSNNISPKKYSKELSCKKFLPNEFVEKIMEEADRLSASELLPITATDPLMRHVTAARKNAKIAGVEKQINFRRIDADWLDFKFEERSINLIVTFLPMNKSYKDLFYNAEYILKKDGMMAVLCISKDLLKDAQQYMLLKDEKTVYSGSQKMHVLFLGVKK